MQTNEPPSATQKQIRFSQVVIYPEILLLVKINFLFLHFPFLLTSVVFRGAANFHRRAPGLLDPDKHIMSKAKHKKDPGKKGKGQNKKDIFKKYAAPRCKDFLYFEQLQKDFYLVEGDK